MIGNKPCGPHEDFLYSEQWVEEAEKSRNTECHPALASYYSSKINNFLSVA